MAAEALGLLRPKRTTLDALVSMLQDPSAEVRFSALCAIGALAVVGEIQNPSAVRKIEELRGDRTLVNGDESIADRAATVIASLAPDRNREK